MSCTTQYRGRVHGPSHTDDPYPRKSRYPTSHFTSYVSMLSNVDLGVLSIHKPSEAMSDFSSAVAKRGKDAASMK